MKKISTFLLCIVALAPLAANAQHNIYIANQTGWTEVALYAYANDAPVFGAWPGLTASSSETINGVAYDKFTTDAASNGTTVALIYNNNGNGQQLKDVGGVVLDKDYYFAAYTTGMVEVDPEQGIEPPVVEYKTLYVDNQSGWETVNVYAWADGQPDLFGAWPGAASKGTETIKGVTYLTYDMQSGTTPYSLIFNNGTDQFDGPVITPSADVFVSITATSAEVIPNPNLGKYKIYIEDKTGWDAFYIYAWGNNLPELFGTWPGKQATETETIDGVEYKVITMEGNGEQYNLIFNNNAGTQYDATSITVDRDYTFVATPTALSSIDIIDTNEAPATYYDLRGIRTDRPASGNLYIEVRGTTARKVRF